MQAEFNFTYEEKIKIKDFKERLRSSRAANDQPKFADIFMPAGTDLNSGYLYYNFYILALNGDGKRIETLLVAEGVQL